MTDAQRLKIVGVYKVEPEIVAGVSWGENLVLMEFPRMRPSKGWRKHVRRAKQEARQ